MRFAVLDFETTGSVAGFPNEPWQLGVVDVVDGAVRPETQFETYFRVPPNRPFSPRAPGRWAALRAELAAAPAWADAWPALCERLLGVSLVAHNAATERTILTRRAPLTPWGPWIDTLALARRIWPILRSYALGDIIQTLGLEATVRRICPGRTWHDALFDAVAGAVLFERILKTVGEDACHL